MLRSIKDLQSFAIRAADGDIGRVDHFLFDDRAWVLRYVVVDTGQWLPGRRVLISPRAVAAVDVETSTLVLNLTQQKIHDSPGIDAALPVSRQKEAEFHDYYGYPYYWGYVGGAGSWAAWSHPPGAVLPPMPASSSEGASRRQEGSGPDGDPHLRSSKEVIGYTLHATDGGAGHVGDFLVDDAGWGLKHLVVSTGGWIGGRDLLLPVERVTRIDWEGSQVHVNATRDDVRGSREFDRRLIGREDTDAASPDSVQHHG